MSLNSTPGGERLHIGIFGRRNSGKSSLVNALTGQELSIVSDMKGTTTDPVYKAMELLPLGPVVFIDTPGLDDEGPLGALRVKKAYQALSRTELALLVIDGSNEISHEDSQILEAIKNRSVPCGIVINKTDMTGFSASFETQLRERFALCPETLIFPVSALTGEGIETLKNNLPRLLPKQRAPKCLVADLVAPGDTVLLVVPIDASAPKGRLILPQQQTIRELLEYGIPTLVTRETEVSQCLSCLKDAPSLVITDSQVFETVNRLVPATIRLTSFSILFARYKGALATLIAGAGMLDKLKDHDTILISEGCTHHRQCEDIGSVKLPGWVKGYTGKILNFEFTSGMDFPQDFSKYKLVIHCGGCMLNGAEMAHRIQIAESSGTPITNYGIAIARLHGILDRSISALNHFPTQE